MEIGRGNMRDGRVGGGSRRPAVAADIAGHVQLAALTARHVLEAALPINVPGADVGGIHRQPNPSKVEFVGHVDAALHQLGADAEVLKSGPDYDQHFAFLPVDGEDRRMSDDRGGGGTGRHMDAGAKHILDPTHARFILQGG